MSLKEQQTIAKNNVFKRLMELYQEYGMIPLNCIIGDKYLETIYNYRGIIYKLLNEDYFFNPALGYLMPTDKAIDAITNNSSVSNETINLDAIYVDGFDPRKLKWKRQDKDSKGKPLDKGPYEFADKANTDDITEFVKLLKFITSHRTGYIPYNYKDGMKYWIQGNKICRRPITGMLSDETLTKSEETLLQNELDSDSRLA